MVQSIINISHIQKKEVKMKYYKRDSGTIIMVDENMRIFYLDNNKNWVNNQKLLDMFIEDFDYVEITEEEVKEYL